MTLTDFLLARIAEDEESDIAQHRARFIEGVPAELEERAAAAHDHLAVTQAIRLNYRLRAVGWAFATTPPLSWFGFGRAARQRAAVYADHPDYDEAWRP